MRAKHKRAAFGLATFSSVCALIWWIAWCFHSLSGWTAFPIGFTVGGIIYGVGCLLLFAGVGVEDDQ